MNIVILGLNNDNIGDSFIPESTAWLIKKAFEKKYKNIKIIRGSFNATKDKPMVDCPNRILYQKTNLYNFHFIGIPLVALRYVLLKIMRKSSSLHFVNAINKIRHLIFKIGINYERRCKKYFENKFKNADLIVFAGGGLTEYAHNEFYEYIHVAVKTANKLNIPVVFNAIGNSGKGYDPKDFRCRILMKALRYPNIKYISVRDSVDDIQKIVGQNLIVELTADPAFFVSEIYDVKKEVNSNTIGIGLIRGDAFLSYYKSPNEKQLISLYVEIANELIQKGYNIEFFTNGMQVDYVFAKKVMEKLNNNEVCLAKRPTSAIELMNTLKKYKGVIVGRMHASIASFSMGIPSVILPWNNKVIKYMKIVGYPERAIEYSNLNADFIVRKFEKSLKEGISHNKILFFRKSAEKNVENFLSMFISDDAV